MPATWRQKEGNIMSWHLPQAVLSKVFKLWNTNPETLTESEKALARRICHCVLCAHLWLRRKQNVPARCPRCFSRNWNRPYLNLLLIDHRQNEPDTKPHLSPEERALLAAPALQAKIDE